MRTYIPIANLDAVPVTVRITILADQALAQPLMKDIVVPARSRVTFDVAAELNVPGAFGVEGRFGAIVESLTPTTSPLLVERATYWTALGVPFEAGMGAFAVPLP